MQMDTWLLLLKGALGQTAWSRSNRAFDLGIGEKVSHPVFDELEGESTAFSSHCFSGERGVWVGRNCDKRLLNSLVV